MADKKILLFAVLLLAACTADPAMDGADGGNSSANTAAAAKLINTPYDAKQGSLIVCFDDAAVPTIEATAASFAATRGDAGDAAVLTRSGIAPVDEVLQGLEITSLRRVFPYTPRHEERTRAAGLHKWYVVTFDEQADLEAAALKLAAVAEVRNVEFNTKLYVTSVGPRRPLTAADMAATRAAAAGRFNDPQLSRQWHYNNNGDKTVASTSRAGADINAQDAWAITAGNPGVVVAIVDQGVKYTHPDLAANMWINTQEKNGATGADDDGNGYIDDIYGYNFVTRGAVSWDREVWVGGENKGDSGHGTHVAGTVAAVNRGEKRKVLSVTVTPDASQEYEEFEKTDLGSASREQIVSLLLRSGLWPMIVQRPYGIIADPSDTPKAVFISAFDSAPLAPDYNFVLKAEQKNLQTGIDVMRKLTPGKVHLSVRAKAEGQMPSLKGAELHAFAGKHPVGNVGVQIHHVDPVNKGEVVWTVNIQDLAIIGRLFNEGRVDMTKIIAVAGSEIERPQYVRMVGGAKVDSLVKGNVKRQKEGDSVRFISGNVLTGTRTAPDGFMGFYANQLTAIPEGDKYELLGWAMPRFGKFSVSRAYFSWLCPKKAYNLDTNMNGGERPFVVTGLYEQYLPMDIYPMYLLKACLAGDIDKMENLGIYEVTEEDFALCEFVDPSKIEIQQIIRDGINLMIKEA